MTQTPHAPRTVPAATMAPGPLGVDRYTETLRRLDAATGAWTTALADAHRAAPAGHSAALVALHNQVRAMGCVLNHAIGGWPEPPDPKEGP